MCYAAKQYWYVCRGLDRQPLGDKYVRRVISERTVEPKYYPSSEKTAEKTMVGKRIYHSLFGEGIIDSVSGNRAVARFCENGKIVAKQISLVDKTEERGILCHLK